MTLLTSFLSELLCENVWTDAVYLIMSPTFFAKSEGHYNDENVRPGVEFIHKGDLLCTDLTISYSCRSHSTDRGTQHSPPPLNTKHTISSGQAPRNVDVYLWLQ